MEIIDNLISESIKEWWLGLVSFFILVVLIYLICKFTEIGKRTDRLVLPALIILFTGFCLYCIGFHEQSEDAEVVLTDGNASEHNTNTDKAKDENSYLAIGLRSLISSTEMFISHNDLLEVDKKWHRNPVYMTIFAITHFLAIFLTMLAALNLLGGKLWQNIKRWWFSVKREKIDTLYLFFGVNEASLITASRINNDSVNKQIIFVEFPEESEGEHINFESLIGMSSLKHGILEKIKHIEGAILCYGHTPMTEIEILDPRKSQDMLDAMNGENFSVFAKIGLGGLVRYIKRSANVKMFFLADEQQENIRSFEALCSDPFVLKNIAKNETINEDDPKFIIYCHARRNNQNLLYENNFLDVKNIEVHIVDSSYLSTYYLKSNLRYNPISFVDVKDGCVTSDFNAMIIGFGETGQDAFDFLYEFGAFEGAGGKKSRFHCSIFDANMDEILGQYSEENPAIVTKSDAVEFCKMSHLTKDFWAKLKEQIKTLNYIVISLGDDEEALSLAINIYNFARKERNNNLSRFKIFVRVYENANEKRMNSVVDYYNRNNPVDTMQYYQTFCDEHTEKEEGYDGTIVVFGELDEIYKLDYLYNEDETNTLSYINKAKKFYEAYQTCSEDNRNWDIRRANLIFCKGEQADRLAKFQELKRKEIQDLENSLHVETKMMLLGLIPNVALDDKENKDEACRLLGLYDEYCQVLKDYLAGKDVSNKKNIVKALIAVAKTEHYRWVASHEILGYSPRNDSNPSADEVRQLHGCMCSWDELDAYKTDNLDYKLFDFMTVLTSLEIKRSELARIVKMNKC